MVTPPSAATPSRRRWLSLVWIIPAVIAAIILVVLLARWMREIPAIQSFLTDYPGESHLPEGAPVGFPAWLAWQHYFNSLLLLLIIRSGWQIRTETRPDAFWTRRNRGLLRTKNPPKKISVPQWFHLSLDALWIANGIVFVVLLFATGQWMRVVPTGWEVFPNALSAALQYASFDWPLENGWVNYNSLQVLAYFTVIFIASPLAIASGLRMSPAWPQNATRLGRLYPIELARAVHFPVMLFFVLFIIAHVTLVFATGALRNLNHMYAVRDDDGWLGVGIFGLGAIVMVGVWFAASPLVLRSLASLTGTVTRR